MAMGSHSFSKSPTKTRLPSDFDILVPFETDHPHVEPVTTEGLARHRLRLGRLALVVGEDEVAPSSVEIDGVTQLAHGQGRAFDVPAGPARTPAGLPGRFVGGRRLPQHEVERVALVGIVGLPTALGRQLEHLRTRQVAHLTEGGERGDVEVHRPARLVGMAAVENGTDQRQDVGNGRGGPGLPVDGQETDALHGGVEAGHLLGGQVEVVHPELPGPAQDVVVDVGDVAHQPGLVAGVTEPTLEEIEGQVHLDVPHVGAVVRRDPARVHGDDRTGLESDHILAGRVVEPHHGDGVRSGTRLLPSSPNRAERAVGLVADIQPHEHGGESFDGAA
jgi:hypothetical protein